LRSKIIFATENIYQLGWILL